MRVDARTIAVITGGAGGLGEALANDLVSRGAFVALIDIDGERLRDIGKRLDRCSTHECDVSNVDAVEGVAAALAQRHGKVHLLVNAAGISVAGTIDALPLEPFVRAMAVNFWGSVHTVRAFLPLLRSATRADGEAVICNVLSDFALCALPTKAAYASSKHAARAFSESLGAELEGSGISVTAAYLGATATRLVVNGFAVDPSKQAREAALLSKGMSPSVAARRLIRAVERQQSRVLIGYDARSIDLFSRLSPRMLQFLVRRLWRRVPFL